MNQISAYQMMLFVHVSAGIALIGSSLFAPLARRLAIEASTSGELKTALVLGRRAARFNPALAFALLGTGVYMGSLGWWHQPWFLVAFAGWWLNFLLAMVVVKRVTGALAQAVFERGEGLSDRVDQLRRSMAWTVAARVMLATDFALLFIMFNKPGLEGSLVVLVGAILALGGSCVLKGVRRSRAAKTLDPAVLETLS